MSGLDTYLMSDQPQSCPKCGVRTEWKDLPNGRQFHACHRCEYTFLVEEDLEFEDTLMADKYGGVAHALRNYMRLVKYLQRTTNPEEWATHGDWAKLQREAVEALDQAGEESRV